MVAKLEQATLSPGERAVWASVYVQEIQAGNGIRGAADHAARAVVDLRKFYTQHCTDLTEPSQTMLRQMLVMR